MKDLVVEMAAKLNLDDDQRENLRRFMAEVERATEESSATAEIDAMRAVAAALETLDGAARSRVLGWAKDRFTHDTRSVFDLATQFAHIIAAEWSELRVRERELERAKQAAP